jgi:hypothetical protein
MRMKLFLILVFFNSSIVLAVPPSNMALIDSLEQIDKLNEAPPVNCLATEYDRTVEGFSGTVSCKFKCKNQEEITVEVENNFTNRDMNLGGGDGGLHRSFNITLDLWLDSICLQVGMNKCGPNNLESTNLKKLTSGNWVYTGSVYCPTLEEAKAINDDKKMIREVLPNFNPLRHPFEKTAGTNLSTAPTRYNLASVPLPLSGFNVILENQKIAKSLLFDKYSLSEEFMKEHSDFYDQDDITPKKVRAYILKVTGMKDEDEFVKWRIKEKNIQVRRCSNPISVHACYGDCIIQRKKGGFIAMMATNEISESNIGEKVVCGDNLYSFIKKNNIPATLQKNYCRMFLNYTFSSRDEDYSGTSCSAFRFRDPCEEIEFN